MVTRVFWVFSPMLDSQILDDNESDNKVTNWVPTSISQKKKKKSIESILVPIMSNLANGQQNSSSLYNFLHGYKCYNFKFIHDLNLWSRSTSNDFTLNNWLFRTIKLTRNAIESEFIYNG